MAKRGNVDGRTGKSPPWQGGDGSKIHVTQEDIDAGKACLGSVCPISMAIKRQRPTATRIETDMQLIRWSVGRRRYYRLTPRTAQQFIVDFDAGVKVKPFSFNLGAPTFIVDKTGEEPKTKIYHHEHRGGNGSTSTKVTVHKKKPPRTNPNGRKRVYGACGLRHNQVQVKDED